jgi:UDP-N-acetylmuramoyl-tripeptide--D-alanyl-D-alanine ligase
MLELGDHAPDLHAELAEPIAAGGIDKLYLAGPAMRHLHNVLPPERRGGHVDDAAALVPLLQAELAAGDTLLVKGSLGMRMARIVEALLAEREPLRRARAGGR